MKIKVKDGGLFKIDFTDYFKTTDSFKEFIKFGNEFINVDFLETKISHIYKELSNLDIELKTNLVLPIVIKNLNFKHKSAFKLEFWEERGYGVNEFNNWICKRRNIHPVKKITPGVANDFKYGNYDFQFIGEPKCNLCGSNLKFDILVNKYIIKDCKNHDCHSHKNKEIKTIRQLAFLPKDVFLDKNKRINHNSKLSKEYWLLRGFSLEDSKKEIYKIRKKLKGVHQATRDYYRIATDMSEDEIVQFFKEKSHLSSKYWISRGIDDFEDKIKEHQQNSSKEFLNKRKENPELYSATTQTQVGYWLNKGFSEEEAKEKLSDRQTTFSLDICIEKYGEDEGMKRWIERQEKWHSSYKKSNFSKVSQELFWEVYNNFSEEYRSENEIYFATLGTDKLLDESNSNNEYRLMLDRSFILPDFFVKNKNKIIEFDGTYYHRNNSENKKREKFRDESIVNSGYEVLHIKECDYKNDKQKVIDKCLKFLNIY